MNVGMRQVRAALMEAWAKHGSTAFRTYLVSQVIVARALVASGMIQNSNADGHDTTWATGRDVTITGADIVDIAVYLVEEFDRAYAILGGTPTDTAVETLMESNMRPIMDATDNFMYLMK